MSQLRNAARRDSCSAVACRSIRRSMAQPPSEVTPVSAVTVDCAAVDFDLSGDQQALRDAAASLLDRMAGSDALAGPGRARRGRRHAARCRALPSGERGGDAPTGYDDAVWSAMAEQGWLALELPEDEGGLGLGMVELAVLCEEIGRRLVAAPFLPTIVALGALCGDEARADAGTKEWREALGQGEAVGCVARRAGPRSGSPWPGPEGQVRLERADAPGGLRALGRRGRGRSPTAASTPSTCAPRDARPRCRPWTAHASSGSWPSTARRRGSSAARTPPRCCVDRAATLASAEMLGAADHVLAMTVQYAKDRVQFGKPIGSFQAVKHMLADALVDVEGMRSTVYYAAWCAAAGDPERSLAASMAKAWCSDASRRVMAAGLQVHGGIGFTWEHDMHLYLKRAQLDQVSYGDAAAHRDRIATLLRTRLEAGESLS